eukprot:snap_masked-scaffold339_size202159-processed-gene-1.14 protein:Tk01777 transcript:snap_masked-scaffold339_size202159-processed-gene-1.14-mRNA-1 annotation:"low quality protein: protein yippee-like 5"
MDRHPWAESTKTSLKTICEATTKSASIWVILDAMGRVYLEHLGGSKLFNCVKCGTFLTNRQELISTRFTGATGRAFLFNKVVNLKYSEVQDRLMLTGRHMVRDVSCKKCSYKLGWMYEFALEESQRYKEGRTILERALVVEEVGLEEAEVSS